MESHASRPEWKDLQGEVHSIWESNAEWWYDKIGDGNSFQNLLIEPANDPLLAIEPNDLVLDVCCGAGRSRGV